jgi:Metal-dependent hydrolases of the beta-lactamase superfamily I
MIRYAVLSSGSCGNCYAFFDGKDTILIDMGLTFSALMTRLDANNIPIESVRGCFVTHLHPDHSKGLGVLTRKLSVPVFMSRLAADSDKKTMGKLNIRDEYLRRFEFGDGLSLGAFSLTPFRTSHDSVGSAGYVIENGEAKVFLLTDCGRVDENFLDKMRGSDLLFIEANYDEEMLINGPYPWPLKRRIMGEYGHMSNNDAISLLKKAGIKGKMVYFIHLSATNNTVECVNKTALSLFEDGIGYTVCERGVSYGGQF